MRFCGNFGENCRLTPGGTGRILAIKARVGRGFCRWWRFLARSRVADDGHTAFGVLSMTLFLSSDIFELFSHSQLRLTTTESIGPIHEERPL